MTALLIMAMRFLFLDERFFYALHFRIERAAAPAVGAMAHVCAATTVGELSAPELTWALEQVARGLLEFCFFGPQSKGEPMSGPTELPAGLAKLRDSVAGERESPSSLAALFGNSRL